MAFGIFDEMVGPSVLDRRDEMKRRLEREMELTRTRLERGLDRCDEFQSEIDGVDLINLVHGHSKWLKLHRIRTSANYNVTAVCHALERYKHRTRHILYFGLVRYSEDQLTQLIPMARNMTSLTSISIIGRGYKGQSHQTLSALLQVIQENRNILSISGVNLTDEIRFALRSNLDILGKRTAISFEGFQVTYSGSVPYLYSFFTHCTFTIRFFAPKEGKLVLRLCHNSDSTTRTLGVKEITSFQHPIPERLVTENIILSPTIHFTPGMATALTFMPPDSDYYELNDIQLLDESLRPYDAAVSNNLVSNTGRIRRDILSESSSWGTITSTHILSK
jgi:hypothetical protein